MEVRLIGATANPIATILDVWDISKTPDARSVELRESDRDLSENELDVFRAIMAQEIPVTEHVTFNFAIYDAPISWREQAVRHRVGVKKSDNFAVDLFPEDGATFWSQSMRLLDMSDFATREQYHVPESIAKDAKASEVYHDAMRDIADAYGQLTTMCGIPLEDARNLIPQGATSAIVMTINLRALLGIVGNRGCWILQSSLWGPVIRGIANELATKIHPVFRELVAPPCVKGGRFRECTFKLENERRIAIDPETDQPYDPMPVCPLYWTSERPGETLAIDRWPTMNPESRIPEYAELWNQPDLSLTWKWEDR